MRSRSLAGQNILHAVNVHQGGGRSLLLALLAESDESRVRWAFALLDDRLVADSDIMKGCNVRRYRPTVLSRLRAEWWLYRNIGKNDTVFCFGNLPPIFSLQGRVVVYVQNRYLIEDRNLSGFAFKVKLRLLLERLWLKIRVNNVDEYMVQTPSMKCLMERNVSRSSVVSIKPFIADAICYQRSSGQKRSPSDRKPVFLYVASAEPHKNHKVLIDAWCLLAEEGLNLKLLLTFDEVSFFDVADYLRLQTVNSSLNIQNLGSMSHSSIIDLYHQVDALIYPSKFESFGLPLIEARQVGLDILAPEMDYVRDLIDPKATFDPSSAVSIAKSVKRYIGVVEKPLRITSAKELLSSVLNN